MLYLYPKSGKKKEKKKVVYSLCIKGREPEAPDSTEHWEEQEPFVQVFKGLGHALRQQKGQGFVPKHVLTTEASPTETSTLFGLEVDFLSQVLFFLYKCHKTTYNRA